MTYIVAETNHQNELLKNARHIARTVWIDNYKKDETVFGNTMRATNVFFRVSLGTQRGYPILHNVIFSTLHHQGDDYPGNADAYYKGLYAKLFEAGISFKDLENLLEPELEQTLSPSP